MYQNEAVDRVVERGEIYWVSQNPAECYGSTIRGDRPAIIVSNNRYNQRSGNVEIVFLTTSPKKDMSTHVTIRSTNQVSTALCEQITTIDKVRLGGFAGRCTKEEMEQVDRCLMISLALGGMVEPVKCAGIAVDEKKPHEVENQTIMLNAAVLKKEAELYKTLYYELIDRVMAK